MKEEDLSDFEGQFKTPEDTPFQGSYIKTWDLKPAIERPGSVPILFVPGWGASPHPYKDGLEIYFTSGRRVITVLFPSAAEEVAREGIPPALATKTAAILQVLREKGLKEVDGIGYSEGSLILQLAAHEEECRFRNIILQAPTGLLGKTSHMRILRAELLNLFQFLYRYRNTAPEKKRRILAKRKDVQAWIKNTGLLKSYLDGVLSGRFESAHLITALQECPRGHRVAIIAAEDDKMIPQGKLLARIRDLKIDHFYSVPGGHHTFEIEATDSAKLSESLLQKFEDIPYS